MHLNLTRRGLTWADCSPRARFGSAALAPSLRRLARGDHTVATAFYMSVTRCYIHWARRDLPTRTISQQHDVGRVAIDARRLSAGPGRKPM